MTHPPAGPSQPPRPSGPRDIPVLDPDSDGGRQCKDLIEGVLARVELRLRGRNNSSKRHGTDAA